MNTVHAQPAHIAWLDGLRGGAALWVLLSHAQILSGLWPVPVLSWGELAVDLFMMLSGFLMAHHYLHRRPAEPWEAIDTAKAFWVRRFFRIAPLYYVLLAAAVLIGPWVGEHRNAIATVWPASGTTNVRFTDQSWTNILMHASFVFGAVPGYAFRTALPDWSIGLEMQFYLVFPAMMLLFAGAGALAGGALMLVLTIAATSLFPHFMAQFSMPSFLALKLYMFMAGTWLAFGRAAGKSGRYLLASIAAIAIFPGWSHPSFQATRVLMVIVLFYLMDAHRLPLAVAAVPVVKRIRKWFTGRIARFMGDTSYAVYLLHLLILTPVAGNLSARASYVAANEWLRFVLCASVTVVLTYPAAWVLHKLVELPGIRLSKQVVRAMRESRGVDALAASTRH